MNILRAASAFMGLWTASTLALAADHALHHDMEIRLDPKARSLAVTDSMRVHGQGSVTFRLSSAFVITSFTLDGRQSPPLRSGDDWRVDLGNGGEHRLVIDYKGTLSPLPEDPGGFSPSVPIASPDGSYLPDSVSWYPRLGDGEFTYSAAIEVPEPQKAVMPGRLMEEKTDNGVYRAVFAAETPTPGLVLLAGPYIIEERFAGDILLRTYFHQEIAPMAGDYLESTVGYIDLYRRQIGDYPFPAFHIVSGPLPVGLGFAGLTYMGKQVLRLPFIRHISLGHEVAHNWWGNGVYIDYEAGNWGEGLTTFMADYAYAVKEGAEAGKEMRLGWLKDYAALPTGRDRPAVEFMTKTHDASQVVGYNKVAYVFHMLRLELGDEAFNAAIRRFWETMKFRTASWEDIRRIFEQESGRQLKVFFDQWLRRAGAPKLILETAASERAGDAFRITFTLAQENPPYALKVPIRVITEAGEKRFDVSLNADIARHEISTESRPLVLAVDPDFDIFRRLDAVETPPIVRDLTLTADAVAIVLSNDDKARDAAQRLALRLMDAPPRFEYSGSAELPSAPLLVVGMTAEVEAFLRSAGLPDAPIEVAGRGTARVWAARHSGDRPLLVVAANDAAALEALLRPLPHYGRKGYLMFEGSRAALHGSWPAVGGPLTKRLN